MEISVTSTVTSWKNSLVLLGIPLILVYFLACALLNIVREIRENVGNIKMICAIICSGLYCIAI